LPWTNPDSAVATSPSVDSQMGWPSAARTSTELARQER
jgi:hypothetical protein